MTLANRVSTFFLCALAMILTGNSLLLYMVASGYLHDRFQEQLESALQTLVAAVEVEDDDVKWEPSDHTVRVTDESSRDEIWWLVLGDEGRILDRSRNVTRAEMERFLASQSVPDLSSTTWTFLRRDLAALHPKPVTERTEIEQSHVTIIVGRDMSSLRSFLQSIALVLVLLPTLCWLAAAVLGRWFCAQAIRPVRIMASTLRQIRADDRQVRLPVVRSTNDELQELALSINELLDAIFVAYERQRQFAGDAAHQLRTPLTVLQGQIEVAIRRPRSNEEYEQTLSITLDEVLRLNRTVETLLRLARPDEDALQSELQTVDLSRWLSEYLQRWTDHARGPDIRQTSQSLLVCRTRPELLEQILDILLSNAVKFSTAGSMICVNAFRDGQECVLDVIDRGLGIAAEDRLAIYEPFFRSRAARQSGIPGVGLGLSLAQRIAGSANAQLDCESQPGVGSTFRVRISV